MVESGFVSGGLRVGARGKGGRRLQRCSKRRGRAVFGDVWLGGGGRGGAGRRSGRGGRGDDGEGKGKHGETIANAGIAGGAVSQARRKLRVVTTTTIITDLANCIGGDYLEIVGLIQPGDDPHVYEPVPTDSITIESADVIVYNGFDLEMNLMPLIRTAMDGCKHYAVGESVDPIPSSEFTNTPDPHVWNDAGNAVCMVAAIANAFAECDPEHAKTYLMRAKRTNKELKELDLWIRKCIQSIPPKQRMLVTTHDAFQYYARAYGLTILGSLMGINTEEQPSAKMMSELISELRSVKPPAVFFEKTVSPTLIRAVAEDADVSLCDESLYSDSIGPEGSGAETYQRMMAYNTRVIVSALGGHLLPPPLAFSSPGSNAIDLLLK